MNLVETISYFYGVAGVTEHREIRDRHLPFSPTSCGNDGRERLTDDTPAWLRGSRITDHRAAYAPKAMPAPDGGTHLDCPCDIECPRCHAPVGKHCATVDGGGSSGGGFRTDWHATRIKASTRCQAIASGQSRRCDFDDHKWVAHDEATHTGRCLRCGTTAEYTPAPDHEVRATQTFPRLVAPETGIARPGSGSLIKPITAQQPPPTRLPRHRRPHGRLRHPHTHPGGTR